MKKFLKNFSLALFAVIFLAPCACDSGDKADDALMNAAVNDAVVNAANSEATPDDARALMSETFQNVFGDMEHNVDSMQADNIRDYIWQLDNGPGSYMDGLTMDVSSYDDSSDLLLTFDFENSENVLEGSTVNGSMTALITEGISDQAMMMIVNTVEGNPLEITDGEMAGSTIEMADTSVMYDFQQNGVSFSDNIILNGVEYIMNDFLSLGRTMEFVAYVLNMVEWDTVVDFLIDSISTGKSVPSKSLYPLTIDIMDSLHIEVTVDFNLFNPLSSAAVLTINLQDFPMEIAGMINEKISGVIIARLTIEDISSLKLKLELDTDVNNPLVISGDLPDQTIGLEDIQLIIQPLLTGSIIYNGMAIPLDSKWISSLISLLSIF